MTPMPTNYDQVIDLLNRRASPGHTRQGSLITLFDGEPNGPIIGEALRRLPADSEVCEHEVWLEHVWIADEHEGAGMGQGEFYWSSQGLDLERQSTTSSEQAGMGERGVQPGVASRTYLMFDRTCVLQGSFLPSAITFELFERDDSETAQSWLQTTAHIASVGSRVAGAVPNPVTSIVSTGLALVSGAARLISWALSLNDDDEAMSTDQLISRADLGAFIEITQRQHRAVFSCVPPRAALFFNHYEALAGTLSGSLSRVRTHTLPPITSDARLSLCIAPLLSSRVDLVRQSDNRVVWTKNITALHVANRITLAPGNYRIEVRSNAGPFVPPMADIRAICVGA